MLAERWLYDFLIYAYMLSLLFGFAGLMKPNPRATVASSALLFMVWGIELSLIAMETWRTWPQISEIDPILLYTWALISFALYYQHIVKLDIFFMTISSVGLIVLAIQLFFVRGVPFQKEVIMVSELIFVHISLAIIGYVAFSLSSISAFLYYIASFLLKKKQWNRFLTQLPSLGSLQRFSTGSLIVGLPCLAVSLLLGGIWAIQVVQPSVWIDPKMIASLLTLIVYSLILWQWRRIGWQGKRLAWWNVVAILVMIGNVLLSRWSFHHWV
ncbi:cytochrome c biogenesis protein CcsA [Baia soyae]|uniref:HemX protein n=1 Tax=Baia soyae TaxID=1544746 RepID=A0A4R2RIM0_9BACL|nr:cytochrome c biogenesis protein CcsA [Baia soyae]TCP63640.1 HemX protein [Baia soyae]